MQVVSGTLKLEGWQGEQGPATVYVRLLDTSWMDAPSRTVDEVVFDNVRLDEIQEHGLNYHLVAEEVDPRARYQVSALVDLDGDGETSVGDYLTTVAYPVLTRGFPDVVDIRARRIG